MGLKEIGEMLLNKFDLGENARNNEYSGEYDNDEDNSDDGRYYNEDDYDNGSDYEDDEVSDTRIKRSERVKDTSDKYEENTSEKEVKKQKWGSAFKESKAKQSKGKIVRYRPNNNMNICGVYPETYDNDAEYIGNTLLEGVTVIINFENIEKEGDATRLFDFVSGVCMAIGGTLKQISSRVIIATPRSVDLSGEYLDDETGLPKSCDDY